MYGAEMRFEVEQTGPTTYSLVALGAAVHTKNDVERAFLVRASELCHKGHFTQHFETGFFRYGLDTGFIKSAYRTTGHVECGGPPESTS